MIEPSLLIVEDETIVAEDLACKVRQLGYHVAGTSTTGEKALELARRLRPALVLMDIHLAGAMDGIAAAQEIHHECKLPVVFLTAHSDTETIERARQAEAVGYILKPFDERDLRIQIEMALYKHATERRLRESEARLAGINRILQGALACDTEEELGQVCLHIAEQITQSAFGFIDDLDETGLVSIAISNPGWDACAIPRSDGLRRLLEQRTIRGIYGRVITDGKGLFTNDPANHPDRVGMPEGHPSLTSFLGVPLMREGGVVGLVAVGNREGGYTRTEQEALESLAPSIVEAFSRKRAEEKLRKSAAVLQATNIKLISSRRATLTMMPEATAARRQAETVSFELQREVAERSKVEEALQRLNDDLERRVEGRTLELQETQKKFLHAEKLSAIGKLSASIAHEFNNPLQGILSVLRGLKKRAVLNPEDRELLDEAIEETDRVKDLIRSLREFNSPSSGKKRFMDVHKTLDSLLLLFKSDFKGKRIALMVDYDEGLPQIEAIPDQIKQVLLNLLTNATDACLHSGGTITVATRRLDEDRVAIAIKDTGIGIDPEVMDLIFQPFYTTKAAIKGTGLGLSVSHGIVKNHQGEIRVESQPGEGATFTVILPIVGAGDAD